MPIIERGDDPNRFAGMVSPDEHLIKRLGILGLSFAQPLCRAAAGSARAVRRGRRRGRCAPDRPTWEGELQPGDVIHAVNRTIVKDIAALRTAVDELKVGDALVLRIEREGEMLFVAGRVE